MDRFDPVGVIPPAVTPLTPQGAVDPQGVQRLVDHLVHGGVDGIFVLGSCGEGPTLTRSQRSAAIRAFVNGVAGRVPILAGVGETSTARALEAVADAEEAGADALAVMVPQYFLDDDERYIAAHVEAIADASRLPILLYNIPQITRNRFTPALVRRLGELPNVVGLKDSSNDWEAFVALLDAAKSVGLRVFQGAEGLVARSIFEGADGAIPGIANVVPSISCQLVSAARKGDVERALALQARQDRACAVYEAGFWLAGLKGALSVLGICGPTAGLPIRPLDEAGWALIGGVLNELGVFEPDPLTKT
ncbi:MAG: dihydrodipicolinate synthase family protein [Sphingomonadaceae bacterium]